MKKTIGPRLFYKQRPRMVLGPMASFVYEPDSDEEECFTRTITCSDFVVPASPGNSSDLEESPTCSDFSDTCDTSECSRTQSSTSQGPFQCVEMRCKKALFMKTNEIEGVIEGEIDVPKVVDGKDAPQISGNAVMCLTSVDRSPTNSTDAGTNGDERKVSPLKDIDPSVVEPNNMIPVSFLGNTEPCLPSSECDSENTVLMRHGGSLTSEKENVPPSIFSCAKETAATEETDTASSPKAKLRSSSSLTHSISKSVENGLKNTTNIPEKENNASCEEQKGPLAMIPGEGDSVSNKQKAPAEEQTASKSLPTRKEDAMMDTEGPSATIPPSPLIGESKGSTPGQPESCSGKPSGNKRAKKLEQEDEPSSKKQKGNAVPSKKKVAIKETKAKSSTKAPVKPKTSLFKACKGDDEMDIPIATVRLGLTKQHKRRLSSRIKNPIAKAVKACVASRKQKAPAKQQTASKNLPSGKKDAMVATEGPSATKPPSPLIGNANAVKACAVSKKKKVPANKEEGDCLSSHKPVLKSIEVSSPLQEGSSRESKDTTSKSASKPPQCGTAKECQPKQEQKSTNEPLYKQIIGAPLPAEKASGTEQADVASSAVAELTPQSGQTQLSSEQAVDGSKNTAGNGDMVSKIQRVPSKEQNASQNLPALEEVLSEVPSVTKPPSPMIAKSKGSSPAKPKSCSGKPSRNKRCKETENGLSVQKKLRATLPKTDDAITETGIHSPTELHSPLAGESTSHDLVESKSPPKNSLGNICGNDHNDMGQENVPQNSTEPLQTCKSAASVESENPDSTEVGMKHAVDNFFITDLYKLTGLKSALKRPKGVLKEANGPPKKLRFHDNLVTMEIDQPSFTEVNSLPENSTAITAEKKTTQSKNSFVKKVGKALNVSVPRNVPIGRKPACQSAELTENNNLSLTEAPRLSDSVSDAFAAEEPFGHVQDTAPEKLSENEIDRPPLCRKPLFEKNCTSDNDPQPLDTNVIDELDHVADQVPVMASEQSCLLSSKNNKSSNFRKNIVAFFRPSKSNKGLCGRSQNDENHEEMNADLMGLAESNNLSTNNVNQPKTGGEGQLLSKRKNSLVTEMGSETANRANLSICSSKNVGKEKATNISPQVSSSIKKTNQIETPSVRSSARKRQHDVHYAEDSDSNDDFDGNSDDDFNFDSCADDFNPDDSGDESSDSEEDTLLSTLKQRCAVSRALVCNKRQGKKSPRSCDTSTLQPPDKRKIPGPSSSSQGSSCKTTTYDWKDGDIETTDRPCPEFDPPDFVMEPIDYFRYYWDDFFQFLADETNIYSTYRDGKSMEVTRKEIETFFGIWIFMGVCKLPSYEDYWSALTRVPQVADLMSLKRFEKIRARLHLVDSSAEPNGDRLAKVRPLLEHIREKCRALEQKENKFSVDESMVLYKGKKASSLRQYMPKKPHKWGFKFYLLCGVSGMAYDFLPYAGANTFDNIDFTDYEKSLGKGAQVVAALCKSISLPRLSVVCFDNWFTSVALLKHLKEEYGILSTGTVRVDRTGKCPLLTDKALLKEGRGSSDVKVLDDSIACVKWADNKCVTLASTITGLGQNHVVKRWDKAAHDRVEVACPDIVVNYNSMMGGVDTFDMLTELYRTTTRARRWYLPIVGFMISLTLVNSWLSLQRDSRALNEDMKVANSKQFRLHVFHALVSSEKRRGRPPASEPKAKKIIRSPVVPRPVSGERKDNVDHWPGFGEKRQRCRNCSDGFSEVICLKCSMTLCFRKNKNCFVQFHRLP